MGDGLLEVTVLDPRDVSGAEEGGADRLHLAAAGADVALSPEPAMVTAVCRETSLPVFVLLRLNDSWTTTGGELTRLVGLAEDYLGARCERGLPSGSSTPTSRSTPRSARTWPSALPGVPWVFGRAIDDTLDPRRSWRRLLDLPGLAAVRSAGSPRGLEVGFDDLIETAADPAVARLLMPGGGLLAEQVPWFVRADVQPVPPRPAGPARWLAQGVRRRRPRPLLAAARRRRDGAGRPLRGVSPTR